ncbi:MAG: ABC transporter ATP-binding protein [Gemmatimonadota bacterium]
MTAGPAIELRDVRKGYREGDVDHVVLDGVDVSVAPAERVAVLGPSGSGKSTLLNLISGIDLPDAGTVRVGGTDLTALSERRRTVFRRERLGFVFQFFNLIPTLTVLENLLLPLELTGSGDAAGRDRALGLLEAVGLAERASTYPDRLSGGEQQRVAVARAIVHRPRVVLADEPTGNLDEETGERVVALLDELVEQDGLTLVVVTHSADLAGRMDRILRVRHGQVTPDAS